MRWSEQRAALRSTFEMARTLSLRATRHPARSQRLACCSTAVHGGRSLGSIRHGQSARTNQRNALNNSRKGCTRCGASSFHQGQIRDDKLPLFIADIARIRFAAHGRQAYTLQRPKLTTGSNHYLLHLESCLRHLSPLPKLGGARHATEAFRRRDQWPRHTLSPWSKLSCSR